MSERLHNDVDPIETRDWLQAIESVIREEGVERAQYLIDQLLSEARKGGVKVAAGASAGNYVNTIAVEDEPEYPGNLDLERRIRSAIRWNAIMTVLRASKKDLELGGHMASYQSSATFYEVCFNHFFRARTEKDGGDLVYFQGHISPGIYARAFLEGRLTEEQMNNFRQEVHGNGLSSYPHPKLMPEFWQFPTGRLRRRGALCRGDCGDARRQRHGGGESVSARRNQRLVRRLAVDPPQPAGAGGGHRRSSRRAADLSAA